MKVIFMGTPDFAVPTLEALIEKHEVMAVVTQPDKPKGRGKKKKAKIVSKKFLDTANMTGTSFDVEAESDSEDEDMKDDTKNETTKVETPQPRRSITTRSKAKKDDMDVDDE